MALGQSHYSIKPFGWLDRPSPQQEGVAGRRIGREEMGSNRGVDHGCVSVPRRLDSFGGMAAVREHQIGLLAAPAIKPTEPRSNDIQHQTPEQSSGTRSVRRTAFSSPPDWGVAVAHMLGSLRGPQPSHKCGTGAHQKIAVGNGRGADRQWHQRGQDAAKPARGTREVLQPRGRSGQRVQSSIQRHTCIHEGDDAVWLENFSQSRKDLLTAPRLDQPVVGQDNS